VPRVTRWTAPLAAALLLATAACAGDDGTLVTLTGDDCVYDGPGSGDAGTAAFDIVNESDEAGVFELVQIDEASTAEDLEAYVASEQQRIDEGVATQGAPGFVTVVVQLEVEPGEASVLTAGLTPGTYAILCSNGTPPTAIHATAAFEAT
jgi:hypothetical protein